MRLRVLNFDGPIWCLRYFKNERIFIIYPLKCVWHITNRHLFSHVSDFKNYLFSHIFLKLHWSNFVYITRFNVYGMIGKPVNMSVLNVQWEIVIEWAWSYRRIGSPVNGSVGNERVHTRALMVAFHYVYISITVCLWLLVNILPMKRIRICRRILEGKMLDWCMLVMGTISFLCDHKNHEGDTCKGYLVCWWYFDIFCPPSTSRSLAIKQKLGQ